MGRETIVVQVQAVAIAVAVTLTTCDSALSNNRVQHFDLAWLPCAD